VPAVSTSGWGNGSITLGTGTVTVNIAYTGLSGNVTAAHIHGPASRSETAGVLISLNFTGGATGSIQGTFAATAEQISWITQGKTYVNLHTAANGGGEIRGQIELPAGDHPITSSGAAADNYAITNGPGALTVTKAPVTATADNKTRGFGEVNPEFTVTTTGFLGGSDSRNALSVPLTGSTDATANSPAGSYIINLAGGTAANYEVTRQSGILTVTKGVPVITWANPASIFVGTPLSSTQLNATANVAGTFTYVPAAGTILLAGNHTLTAVFQPTDGVNYVVPDAAEVSLTVLTAVVWEPRPLNDILVGTPLTSAQLNATANIPGTIIYSPSSGVILPIGTHVLTAILIPFDTVNNRVTTTVNQITVVGEANTPPTVSPKPLPTQKIAKNSSTAPLALTVGDKETAAGSLKISFSSSNPTIVPVANIVLGGSGANRTVTVTAANATGTVNIGIVVTDTGNPALTDATVLTVNVVEEVIENTPPTISAIANQSTDVDKATAAIGFTVGDTQTAPGQLIVTATSSAEAVAIALGGSGASRTITLTPSGGFSGTATIAVTVSDGELTASTSFQLTVIKLIASPDDFNGDGRADLVLQHTSGALAAWFMNGADLKDSSFFNPSSTGDSRWTVVGSADFNADGKPDLVLQHSDDFIAIWHMNGVNLLNAAFTEPSSVGDKGWKIKGTGDFNGDGKADLLFSHTNGTNAVWYMDGVTRTGAAFINPESIGDPSWTIAGVGDFNGDGKADLLLSHATGFLGVWYLDGINLTQGALLSPASTGDNKWKVRAVADYNGDGKDDIAFQYSDGTLAIWYMDGITRTDAKLVNPSNAGAGWSVNAPK
jgi:hypothetical protein